MAYDVHIKVKVNTVKESESYIEFTVIGEMVDDIVAATKDIHKMMEDLMYFYKITQL